MFTEGYDYTQFPLKRCYHNRVGDCLVDERYELYIYKNGFAKIQSDVNISITVVLINNDSTRTRTED